MLTPVVIFAFNRPDALEKMIGSLKKNPGFEGREIHVFIDGPRSAADQPKISKVAEIARHLTPNVTVATSNNGLGPSIIKGVSEMMRRYGRAIVLEDDLVLMPGFLRFMDAALDRYEADKRVFALCGYGLKIKRPADYAGDVYLSNRASSWGWATWADRWDSVDWNVSDWETLKNSPKLRAEFNKGGSDMFGMLKGFMEGRNKSWAIRFCYSQHRQGRYSVHPFRSLVANEGYGLEATNCRQKYSRFKIDAETGTEPLVLPPDLAPRPDIIRQSVRYHGLPLRFYSKIRGILNI